MAVFERKMYFPFLEDYVITPKLIEEQGAKSVGRLRHLFYTLPESQIQEAINTFNPFPEELKTLYCEIGFGFMNRAKKGKFNSIFDPMTLIYTNKQINYFATPETANELKYYDIEKQLLFFKTLSNSYLAIDRHAVHGKNKIYYRGIEVDSSLYNFLKQTLSGIYDLDMVIDSKNHEIEKEESKKQREIERERERQQGKIKYLGGHRLIDKY